MAPGVQKGVHFGARELFSRSEILVIFELSGRGAREGPVAEGEPPWNLLEAENAVEIPSRPAAPLRGVRRILRATPSAAGPLSTGN